MESQLIVLRKPVKIFVVANDRNETYICIRHSDVYLTRSRLPAAVICLASDDGIPYINRSD